MHFYFFLMRLPIPILSQTPLGILGQPSCNKSLVGGFKHLEKYEIQWEGLSHILWKIGNVWNHEPDHHWITIRSSLLLGKTSPFSTAQRWTLTFRSACPGGTLSQPGTSYVSSVEQIWVINTTYGKSMGICTMGSLRLGWPWTNTAITSRFTRKCRFPMGKKRIIFNYFSSRQDDGFQFLTRESLFLMTPNLLMIT